MNRAGQLTLFILLVGFCLSASDEKPPLPDQDRIRLAEVFRISEAYGNQLWENWDRAPFAVLLITQDYEFLVRHPKPSLDFVKIGHDAVLSSDVFYRKRTFNPDLQATFPAVEGVPTVVIGQAENTQAGKSTRWVLTVLHEHFHQLQMSGPQYYKEVDRLGLSRGDTTGMWMLNFPFPYESRERRQNFNDACRSLARTLEANDSDFQKRRTEYLQLRRKFQDALSADDRKYFSFQVWQEGIARYSEYRIAALAAGKYQPSPAFLKLKDTTSFQSEADQILQKEILGNLRTLDLKTEQRVAFYPFGAAEGLLLDRIRPDWRMRYFVERFSLDSLLLQ